MPHYSTNFSLLMELPNAAALTYAETLFRKAFKIQQGDDPPPEFPTELLDHTEDWFFEAECDVVNQCGRLWLHSDSGGVDAVCAFIHHLLQKFALSDVVTFEWSHDCSKPRTDAYGGGAAVITAQEIKSMSTGQWLRENTPDATPSFQLQPPTPN